jgi:hypothetical protein
MFLSRLSVRKKAVLVSAGVILLIGLGFFGYEVKSGKLFSKVKAQTFSDVPPNYWAYSQIEAAYKAGVISGYPDGTFKPDTIVTRDQGTVFVARALAGGELNNPLANSSFEVYTGTLNDGVADAFANWTASATVAEAVSGGFSGNVAAKIRFLGTGDRYLASDFTSTGTPVGGRTFTLSVYAKADAPTTSISSLFAQSYLPTGLRSCDSQTFNMNLTTSWQRFTKTVTCASDDTNTNLRVILRSSADTTRTMWVDAVQLDGGPQAVNYTLPGQYSCRDVQPTYWAYKYVQTLYEKGDLPECNIYSNGYTLSPTLPLTRDVMAEWLASALAGGASKVPAGPTTATFKDVPTTYWAYKYIQYLAGKSIISGYSDGTFRPTDQVTRAQMAVFIIKAFPALAPTAPQLTTLAASAMTETSATLNGTITAVSPNATIRGFKYSQGASCTDATAVSAGGGSYGVGAYSLPTGTLLQAGTQYSYRSYAINSLGTSYGNCVQFTTSAPTTANISGKVTYTDSTGIIHPLANGYLVIDDADPIVKIGADGSYSLPSLDPGIHEVQIFDQNGVQYIAKNADGTINTNVMELSLGFGNQTINFPGLVTQ